MADAVTAKLVVPRPLRLEGHRAGRANLALQQDVDAVRPLVAALHLSGGSERQEILVTVVRAVQVIAVLRVPEIYLDPPGTDQGVAARRRHAVEPAGRELHLAELAPEHRSVRPPGGNHRIPVLHAIGKRQPVMRVVRAVEICAIARRQEAADPYVEP